MAQKPKNVDSYKDRGPRGPLAFPVTAGTFQTPRPQEGPRVMTTTRIATHARPIPVTDCWHFETRLKHDGLNVTTVIGMAALGVKNDDSYEDRNPERPHPCDCWRFSQV